MPITCNERNLSRGVRGNGDEITGKTLYYVLKGSDDEDAISAQLLATAPASITASGRVLPLADWQTDPQGNDLWYGQVSYGGNAGGGGMAVGDSRYQFDTTGIESIRIFKALEHIADYGNGAYNYEGLIGVSKDGVDGVEVGRGTFKWSEVKVWNKSRITDAYKRKLGEMTGRVNSDNWSGRVGVATTNQNKIYTLRECRFLGAQGREERNKFSITYHFAFSATNTAVIPIPLINPVITIPVGEVKGFDYLWIEWKPVKIPASMGGTQPEHVGYAAMGAHVERIFEQANFDSLTPPV